MKPLIPQTVYVPVRGVQINYRLIETVNGNDVVPTTEWDMEDLDKKENQYIFTKEELIELLGLAYDAVMSRKMGYDHEGFPRGVGFTKEQFINNLLNQQ